MEKIIKYRAVFAVIGFILLASTIVSFDRITGMIALNRSVSELNKIMDYSLPEGYDFHATGNLIARPLLIGKLNYGSVAIYNELDNTEGHILIWLDRFNDETEANSNVEQWEQRKLDYTLTRKYEIDGETAYYCTSTKFNFQQDAVHFAHDKWALDIFWESDLSMTDSDREVFNEFIDSITFK